MNLGHGNGNMATLVSKEKATPEVWRLQIDPKDRRSTFRTPGQYVRLGDAEGKNALFAAINSIPNLVNQDGTYDPWTFYCKDKDNVLAGYNTGDEIPMTEALGPGYPIVDAINQQQNMLFLAMGMGMTSFYACLEELGYKGMLNKATLYYGERDESRLLYADELKRWKGRDSRGLTVRIALSQGRFDDPGTAEGIGENFLPGRIQANLSLNKSIAGDLKIFVCGSDEFEQDLVHRLTQMGAARKNIHFNHEAKR